MEVTGQLTRNYGGQVSSLYYYMSEWCDTAKNPEPSCCYEDAAILYDEGVLPALQVERANCAC